jgi:GTP 3',8-cyclase
LALHAGAALCLLDSGLGPAQRQTSLVTPPSVDQRLVGRRFRRCRRGLGMPPSGTGSKLGTVMDLAPVRDLYRRPLRSLRISVTDRCNLRCRYCMPEEEYVWLPKADILSFEEISRLVDAFLDVGVDKVRLTGGEPLVRRDLPVLVRMLAVKPRIRDLAMTTNGVLLAAQAHAPEAAGLGRLTVSLDTLRPERFEALSRRPSHARVIEGILSVPAAGFADTKIDTVVMRDTNDDELCDLIDFGKRVPAEVRFIEYMDVGGATSWSYADVVSRAEMLSTLANRYGGVRPIAKDGAAPADRFALPDGTTFGIIASTTSPFCAGCDRSRLTADGTWYLCLYAGHGIDLRGPLRAGASDRELAALIRSRWQGRSDRGAVDRLAERERAPLIPVASLRADPRLEMHTRGG